MLLLWLLLAVVLTVVGALIALLTQDASDEHEQEWEYKARVDNQRASIDVARCEIDPDCQEAHTASEHMLALYRETHET